MLSIEANLASTGFKSKDNQTGRNTKLSI